jgi:hypothetical protein
MRKAWARSTILALAGVSVWASGCCSLFHPFHYTAVDGAPQAANDLGQLFGDKQREVVCPVGDQRDAGFTDIDRANFEDSGRLARIVSDVTASATFRAGVASLRPLSDEVREAILVTYRTPIDKTWAMNGEIGKGTTDAGYAVESEIADALTDAVEAAL